MIELVVEISPLKSDNPRIHLLYLLEAVLDDVILALFHLLDLFELVQDECPDLILFNLLIHRHEPHVKPLIRHFNAGIDALEFVIDMILKFCQLLLYLVDERLVLLGKLHRSLITLPNAPLLSTTASSRHEA